MKNKLIIACVLVLIFVGIGMIFGFKLAGGLAALGLGVGGAKMKAKKVDQEQEDLQKQANEINNDSVHRKEKANQLDKEGKNREKEAQKLDDELKETDNKFKNMFHVFLALFLGISLVFAIQGMALAAEDTQLNPDNFKRPDTLAEAEKMIDKLLDFALTYRDAAYQYKNLYEEEKADKEEFKSLYEAERGDNQQLQTIIDNQKTLNDKLQEIIDRLLNSSGGFGFYGGINYKPFKPVESGIEGGITFDF